MFVKVVKNNRANDDTCFIYLTESYRKNGRVCHKNVRNLGKFSMDQVPYIKAAFSDPKPRLVWDVVKK